MEKKVEKRFTRMTSVKTTAGAWEEYDKHTEVDPYESLFEELNKYGITYLMLEPGRHCEGGGFAHALWQFSGTVENLTRFADMMEWQDIQFQLRDQEEEWQNWGKTPAEVK